MGRPKIHLTPEAEREADRISDRKYAQSEKGRATQHRSNTNEAARERARRYRETDNYRAAQARHRASAKWKAHQSLYGKYAAKNQPERVGARAAVAVAVRYGMLAKPVTCPACLQDARVEAHHPMGYALEHWFHIEWLCSPCHKTAHQVDYAEAG